MMGLVSILLPSCDPQFQSMQRAHHSTWQERCLFQTGPEDDGWSILPSTIQTPVMVSVPDSMVYRCKESYRSHYGVMILRFAGYANNIMQIL
jgi:hypothetical protein